MVMVINNLQIMILVGAPCSGKTTFARYFIRTEENWMRLCKDDFRAMQFASGNMSNDNERLISDMIDTAIEKLLQKKCNVLLDAPHCLKEDIDYYIKRFNHLADISFKLFDIEFDTLVERCEKRNQITGKSTSISKLKKSFEDLEELKKEFDFAPQSKIDNF